MSQGNKITSDDASSMHYFISSVGDIERWSGWETKKARLVAALPELDDWLRARRTVDALEKALLQKLEDVERDDDH